MLIWPKNFHVGYPEYHWMRNALQNNVVVDTVKVKLTQSLAMVTGPVNEENALAIAELFPETDEWQEINFVHKAQWLTSRVTSRVFLGLPLCRDPAWLKIAIDFTVQVMSAAKELRRQPAFLRPFTHWFLPECQKIRATLKQARSIIDDEVQTRREKRAEMIAAGEKPPKALDSIQWMSEVVKDRKYDYTAGQLSLTFAAIHTTTLMLTNALYDLTSHPEYIPELRQEIIDVLTEDGGWQKTSLYKLKKMDSVLKESQRLNVAGIRKLIPQKSLPFKASHLNMSNISRMLTIPEPSVVITRLATEDITLKDGTVLPKGAQILVHSAHMMHDAERYPHPEKFDGYRFLRMREEPGRENSSQFVTTSSSHIGFGHGQHACPGRYIQTSANTLVDYGLICMT